MQKIIRKQIARNVFLACLVKFLFFASSILAAPSPTKTYDLSLTKGIMHFQNLQFTQAIEELKSALEIKPESPEANYYLGAVYNQMGNYTEAEPLLKKAVQSNPQLNTEVHFEYGLSLFFNAKYPEAIKEFIEAEAIKEEKAMVYYYKALSYFKSGDYNRSIPIFARASSLDNSLFLNCSYYTGIASYKLGLFDDAREEFESVIRKAAESEAAKSSREYLAEMEKISKESQPKRFAFNIGATVQNDDNVTMEAKENNSEVNIDGKEDSRSILFLQTDWNFLKFSNFKSTLSYVFYQSMHTKMSQFNVSDQTGTLSASLGLGINHFQLSYSYEYIALEKDKYGLVNSISPLWIIQENPSTYTQFFYQNQKKDYHNTTRILNNESRSGTNNQVGISQFYLFLKNKANLRAGFNFDQEKAKEASWDYTGNKILTGTLLPVRKGVRVDLGAEYNTKNFKQDHSIYGIKRKDNIFSYSVTFLVDEGSKDELSLQFLYTDNRSNIDAYRYIRNLYSFTWTKRF